MSRAPEERFWEKVDVRGEDDCWLWTGALTRRRLGYGTMFLDGRRQVAHRISFEWAGGVIPEGHEIDHLCRETRCVNPAHMEPVTHAENIRRGRVGVANSARYKVQSHCKRGHPLYGENLYVQRTTGRRSCLICRREASRRFSERRAA